MQSARQIARLNESELEKCVPPSASWHTDYRDSAYIHIGGLPFELSEGDVLTIFSQYGNPVHLNLVRDKETGKSRGFGFLKYEDQRSCDLAVDNLSGASVLGRVLGVDHCRYKLKEGEIEGEGMFDEEGGVEQDETDREDEGRRRVTEKKSRRKEESESEEEARPMVKEELELAKLLREHDDDDPMKAYLVKEKKAEIAEALKALALSKKDGRRDRDSRHTHHRSKRDRSEDEDDSRKDRHRSRRNEDDEKRRTHKHRSGRGDEDGDPGDGVRSRRERSRDGKQDSHRSHRNSKRSRSPDERKGRGIRRRDQS